jgi:aspartate aminotransferase
MLTLSKRMREIRMSPIRKISGMLEKAAYDKSIISFGGGAPSLLPPKEIMDYLCEKIKKDTWKVSSYGSTKGMQRILELICEMLKDEEKIDINPEKEITLSHGGTEGLFSTFMTLLDKGDEIILSNPTYVGYFGMLKMLGIRHKDIPVHWQEDFQLFPEKINEAITKKTKAIVLLSPDNPTGRVLKKENLKGIVELAEDKKIWLITDDIYKDILFDMKFINSRQFGGYENTLTCCSWSKSASLPGFRAGYVYGPEKVIDKIEIARSYIDLAAQKPMQFCIEKFLENKAAIKKRYISRVVVPIYKKRRDVMADCFKKYLPHAGISMPQGAFYFFPSMGHYLKEMKMTEERFAEELMSRKKVVAIAGCFFGTRGKNHLRMTFVSEPEERIKEGFGRVAEFVRT